MLKALSAFTVGLIAICAFMAGIIVTGSVTIGVASTGDIAFGVTPDHSFMVGFCFALFAPPVISRLITLAKNKGPSPVREYVISLIALLYGQAFTIGVIQSSIAIAKKLAGTVTLPGYPIEGTAFVFLLMGSSIVGTVTSATLLLHTSSATDWRPPTLKTSETRAANVALKWAPAPIWIGIMVGAGTFAGIAASFVGPITATQIVLALISAVIAGGFAGVQLARR